MNKDKNCYNCRHFSGYLPNEKRCGISVYINYSNGCKYWNKRTLFQRIIDRISSRLGG